MADKYYQIKYHLRFGPHGWTYNFYWFGGSAKDAFTHAKDLIEELMAMHYSWASLDRISAHSVQVGDRDNYSEPINYTVLGPRGNPANPDVSKTCALITLNGDGPERRPLYLRCLRDGSIARNDAGLDTPSSTFQEEMDNFEVALAGMSYRIQMITPPDDTDNRWRAVQSIAPLADGDGTYTVLNMLLGHGITTGQRVIFHRPSKVVELLGFRSAHTVQFAQDLEIHIPARYRYRADIVHFPGLFIRPLTYTYPDIKTIRFDRFTTRDTGPARRSRGRKPGMSFR